MRSWIIRIAIIAVIAGGAYLFRDRLSGNAGDLKIGDCFDVPTASGATVQDVQHHPCAESHSGEVIYVGKMTGQNSAYPSQDEVFTFVASNCLPAFASYTGQTYDGQVIDVGFFHPTNDGWSGGDRGVTCYVYRTDGSSTTGSIKVAQ